MALKSRVTVRPWHGVLIVLALLLLSSILIFRGCTRAVIRWSVEHSDSMPLVFPPPIGEDQEINKALFKANRLWAELNAGQKPTPVTLSENELNLIIFYHPKAASVADRLRVRLLDQWVELHSSLPVEQLPFLNHEESAGRYLHSKITLDVSILAGRLMLYLKEVSIKDQPLSAAFIEAIEKENLGEHSDQSDFKKIFSLIHTAYINEGMLYITP